jgi:hypothetical protein
MGKLKNLFAKIHEFMGGGDVAFLFRWPDNWIVYIKLHKKDKVMLGI